MKNLDRPTQVIRDANNLAAKSQINFAYDDVNHIVTTKSDFSTFNDNLLRKDALYDGLGRTTETRAYENSTQYITVKQVPFVVLQDPDTSAWVAASQSSNPYRSYLSESPVWTTAFTDALGRATKVRTPDNAIARTSYSGNTVTVTDQAGKSRKSVTDALGRLTSIYEDPSGLNYATSYSYDMLDDLTGVSQGSQSRTFVYDSLKRLTSATNPESGTVNTDAYDNNGNVLVTTDARGVSTHVSFDGLNRPTRSWYNSSSSTSSTTNNSPSLPSGVAATDEVAYFYDGQTLPSGAPSFTRGYSTGRLVALTYGGGSAGTYAGFDALGRTLRKIQQTDSVNYLVEASYNVSGAMTSETYPSVPGASDRRTVSYSFDTAGRSSSLSSSATSYAPAASVSSISYASHGALSSETYGNSLIQAATYNTRLQISEIKLGTSSNSTSVLDLTYNYGATSNNGNLQSVGYSGGGLSYTQSFSYDALNRLSTATETNGGTTNWSQTNAYDRYGNRQIDLGGGSYNVSFSSITNRITTSGFSYDSAGNLTNDGVHSYSFDAEDKIRAVDSTTAYAYNGSGQRVRKLVGENIRFVYGLKGELIAEFDGASGNLKKEYISGGITVEPTAANSNGTQYGTADHLGTARVITNSSGSIVSRHDYMPFGEELGAGTGGRTAAQGYSASDGARQKFTGYERDNESGLDFAQARYNSSTLGRFTSPDPYSGSMSAGDPQTFNRYAYVGNNPLTHTDPTGLSPGSLPGAEGALGRVNPGGGLDPMFAVERSPANHPDKNQQDALRRLDQYARQADKDGNSALAAGLRAARDRIAKAISALRPGQHSIGIDVAVNAILNVGNTNFANASTTVVGGYFTIRGSAGNPTNKCNVLVAFAHGIGAGLRFIANGGHGRGYPLTKGGVPPAANYLGDKNDTQHLTNIPIVKDGMQHLQIGDIIAWRYEGGTVDGHSAIYIGGGVVVYAGGQAVHGWPDGTPQVQTLNYLNGWLTEWPWYHFAAGPHEPPVVRRYSGQ